MDVWHHEQNGLVLKLKELILITATRFHDFSTGHRVYGHEGACSHAHGHNYRCIFTVRPVMALDSVGRVLDFSVINRLLCQWLEANWDHRFLLWEHDPWGAVLTTLDPKGVVIVPFNPTAENMANHLLCVIGPQQLHSTGTELCKVVMEETRKCSATAQLVIPG